MKFYLIFPVIFTIILLISFTLYYFFPYFQECLPSGIYISCLPRAYELITVLMIPSSNFLFSRYFILNMYGYLPIVGPIFGKIDSLILNYIDPLMMPRIILSVNSLFIYFLFGLLADFINLNLRRKTQ